MTYEVDNVGTDFEIILDPMFDFAEIDNDAKTILLNVESDANTNPYSFTLRVFFKNSYYPAL